MNIEKNIAVERMCEIKGILTSFVDAETGRALRQELHELSKAVYVPQHMNDEYIEWIQEMMPRFETCSPQSTNHPFYMTMFAVGCQHIHGNCLKECLDSGMSQCGKDFRTRDGVMLTIGDNVAVWVSMSGTHTLQRGVVRRQGVITWCGDGVGVVCYHGFSTNEAAIAAGCPCVDSGKPCCKP